MAALDVNSKKKSIIAYQYFIYLDIFYGNKKQED